MSREVIIGAGGGRREMGRDWVWTEDPREN